jgi:cell division protein FtsX
MAPRTVLAAITCTLFILLGAGFYFLNVQQSTEVRVSSVTDPVAVTADPQSVAETVQATAKALITQSQKTASHIHGQPSVRLRVLPEAIQQTVNDLNANDNGLAAVEQVSPTEYRSGLAGIHRAVPVAVLQPDGTIVINEY